MVFVQSIMPTLASTGVDAFANESHKRKSFEDIARHKMATLEARIRVIEGVDLYDLIQAA